MTKHLCVISFDGLSTLDFDYISTLPNFREFLSGASYSKKVYSIYPTLTYPAHATIMTGRYPKSHGIINNTLFQPKRESPDWYWERNYIVRQLLEHFDAIYSNTEAQELGADPKCTFMLEAKKGFYFLNDIKGETITSIKPKQVGEVPHYTKAAHGYSPYKEDYTTVFMAAGKGIKKGVVIGEMHLVDEGPTLATLLGLKLDQSEGRVIHELVQQS